MRRMIHPRAIVILNPRRRVKDLSSIAASPGTLNQQRDPSSLRSSG